MAKTLNLKLAGLWTAPNDFSGVPEGALDVADNIVIDQKNLGQPRKGFRPYAGNSPNGIGDRLGYYKNFFIGHFGDSLYSKSNDASSSWSQYSGLFLSPDVLARTRFLSANQNFYITTADGIKKLDDPSATPTNAGVPKALDMSLSLVGDSGFLTANEVASFSTRATIGSPNLTYISDTDVARLFIGQTMSGTGIPDATVIEDISTSAVVIIATGDTTAGSTSITLDTDAGIVAGQIVRSEYLQANTRVVSISGGGPSYTLVVDLPAVGSSTGESITITTDNTVTLSASVTGLDTIYSVQFPTFAAAASGDYFVITDGSGNEWAAALDKTGVAPAPAGADWVSVNVARKVKVNVSTATTASDVATLVLAAFSALTDFAFAFTNEGAGLLTFTNQTATPPVAGAVHNTGDTGPGSITISTSGTAQTISATASEGSQIAYEILFGKRDANNNLLLGAPSSFTTIVNNSGHSTNVQAIATLPAGLDETYFYQLYRSVATPTANIVPVPQFQLVSEAVLTSTDLTNGYVTVLDQTPDSLKGSSLYSGDDVEGAGQVNDPPPFAWDFASFRNHTLYGNVKLRPSLKLIMDGVGAPNGIQVGDEITIDNGDDTFTVEAAVAEDIANGEFQVYTSGTPAQNIADTANSFIRVVNRYAANTIVYAYLISGPNDLPGQILLQTRIFGSPNFAVTASTNGDAWTPNLPMVDGVSSEQESLSNIIMVSKVGEPEAVPTLNQFPVGSRSNVIYRLIPLRDYAVILSEEGIFRFTGYDLSSFTVEPYDLTTKIVAPDTAVALGNECWFYSNQGVVSFSDAGVRIRSVQIDDVLRALQGQAPQSIAEVAFAVAYETDHRYILCLPDSEGDETTVQQYCFNYITEAWTRWTRNTTTGVVERASNLLYLINGDDNVLVQERKTGTAFDYADEEFGVNIASQDGLLVTLDTVQGLVIGDVLLQIQDNVQVYAEIEEIDFASNTVLVTQDLTWDVGAAFIYPAVDTAVQWKPLAVGDPTEAKQASEGQLVFRKTRFSNASLGFLTDIVQSYGYVPIEGTNTGAFGLFEFGMEPWGGVNRSSTIRYYVPADKQYCGALTMRLQIRAALSDWQLEGISVTVFDISGELGR